MSERFYVNLPLAVGPCTLDGPEAHHLATVRRFRPGDAVCLFNGDGREYPARIVQAGLRDIALEILGIEQPARELSFALEVAAPVPKGDRGQFLIEKLTELGAATFVPLLCQRSNAHPREWKRDKLERYVIEASKQCGRNVLMAIAEPARWEDYAASGQPGEVRIFGDPSGWGKKRDSIKAAKLRIAVGPEGGFTAEETAHGLAHGWLAINLGPRILRIETAAIALAVLAACEMIAE